MSETPPEASPHADPYASDEQVRVVLGGLADRLPATISLEQRRAMAHAEVLERLVGTYGTLPSAQWRPEALLAVQWAEAKIAAADILDIIRATRSDDSAVADKLRASAYATLGRALPGQPIADDGSTTPPVAPLPYVPRSTGGASVFADPYADIVGGVVLWP